MLPLLLDPPQMHRTVFPEAQYIPIEIRDDRVKCFKARLPPPYLTSDLYRFCRM